MAFVRLDKISELLKREISAILLNELKDPHLGFLTVTRVSVTPDLKFASAYVSVLGTETVREESLKRLNSAAGFVQHLLTQRVRLRTVPRIAFEYDRGIDHSFRVAELLDQIHRESPSPSGETPVEQTDRPPDEGSR